MIHKVKVTVNFFTEFLIFIILKCLRSTLFVQKICKLNFMFTEFIQNSVIKKGCYKA